MTHVPKCICTKCNKEMKVTKNGVLIQMIEKGEPYYQIHSDEWECPICKSSIYTGFGTPVLTHEKASWNSSPDVIAQFS